MRRLFRSHGTKLGRKSRGALWGASCLLLTAILLVACGPRKDAPAPVGELSISSSASQGAHVVQSGDTLYSVAFRYGVDFRDLAEWNGIDDPYTIFVGQNLRLEPLQLAEAVGPTPVEDRAVAPPVSEPAKVEDRPVPAQSSEGQAAPKRIAPSAPQTAEKKKSTPARKETAYTQGPIRWQWPTEGPVLSTFSTRHTGRKGIDIGGKIGEPVRAAAGGKIVYSGSGLVGYGKLIIVKHNENYLSAYAHNSELLVREGQAVNTGEKIALKGASGKQPQLHFEIRRNGKPVNPLTYLPRR
ncbi:MAG: peptidoglycan DD-metalloendopeptidase family protein [Gammaproteobacteria bacterium]|nr:peptidoglycan DD-metalloendopeptidase family protein [Gammaproteobacteria bacterium]MCP5137290.1 peptidoglycan DD-metalloendopeptidase family protein [Gammaproteobacteria bacterium]